MRALSRFFSPVAFEAGGGWGVGYRKRVESTFFPFSLPRPRNKNAQPLPPQKKKKKQELGIAAADLKRLKEGGINTIECLAHATKKELCLIKGISEAKVVKMQQEGK